MCNDCSFIELCVCECVYVLLDDGSCCELLDLFDGIMLLWFGVQGIVL